MEQIKPSEAVNVNDEGGVDVHIVEAVGPFDVADDTHDDKSVSAKTLGLEAEVANAPAPAITVTQVNVGG